MKKLNLTEINETLCIYGGHILTDEEISEKKSLVNSPIYITNSIITGNVDFYNTHISSPVVFAGTRFNKSVNFNNSYFENYTDFQYTYFNSSLDLFNANFQNNAYFWNATFNDTVCFNDCYFYTGSFGNCYFSKDSFFNWANFGDGYFTDARFLGATYFQYTDFINEANFEGATFYNSLDLTGMNFDKLIINLKNINYLICNNEVTYSNLIKNFRDMEQFENSDNCYFEYRWWRQWQSDQPFMYKILDAFSLISCGYGVRPWYTIACGGFLMTFFGVYFFLKRRFFRSSSPKTCFGLRSSIFFSLLVLISAPSDFFINIYNLDIYAELIKNNKFAIISERIIGWGLLILFISTLSRIMIRY